MEITVEKKWASATEFQPGSVTIELYKQVGSADKELVDTQTLQKNDDDPNLNWKYKWTNLPKNGLDNDGNSVAIVYTAVENPVPDSYTVSYSPASISGQSGTITVTNTPEVVSITVEKTWPNPQSDIQPTSVKVELKADGQSFDPKKEVELKASNNWKYTWTGLQKYSSGTTPIVYTVVEDPVPTGYTVSYSYDPEPVDPATEGISGQNGTITVSNTPILIDIPVVKVWDDNEDEAGLRQSSVTVKCTSRSATAIRCWWIRKRSKRATRRSRGATSGRTCRSTARTAAAR